MFGFRFRVQLLFNVLTIYFVFSTNALVAQANVGTFTSLTLGEAYDFAWSPDSAAIAVAAQAGIGIYDSDFRELARFSDDLLFTSRIVWSPDGSQFAYTREDGSGIVRGRTSDTVTIFNSAEVGENSVLRLRVFNPNGTQIAGEIQTVGEPRITDLAIWEVESGSLVERRTPPLAANQVFDEVYDVYWDETGLTLLIGVDGEEAGTYVWQPDDTMIRLEASAGEEVIAAGGGRFSDDGELISARLADIDGAGLWQRGSLDTPQQVFSPAVAGAVNALNNSLLLFGGANGQLQLLEAATGNQTGALLQLDTTRVLKGAWQPESNRFAALGQDGVVRLLTGDSGDLVNALYAHARVGTVSWSPDSERITAWSNEPVDDVSVTFDVTNGVVVSGAEQALDPTQPFALLSSAEQIAWASDGSLAAWARPDGVGVIYEHGGAQPLLRLDGYFQGFTWSPVAPTLAAVGDFPDASIEIYTNVSRTGVAEVLRLNPPNGENLRALAWSPDGTTFAVAAGQTELDVFLYDFEQQQWSETIFNRVVGAGTLLLDWRMNGLLYMYP